MKISIITITYNSSRTLKDTIDSVLKQRHRPLQYILVDGKSTDNTLQIVQDYKNSFDKAGIELKWISEPDKGISDAFNKGIKMSDGKLVGIINSDDKLTDESLNILASNYEDNISVYYGNCIIFNDLTKEKYEAMPSFSKNKKLLRKGMALFHPSTFIAKSAYDNYGLYDVGYKYCMDRDILLRMYSKGARFKYINESLAAYREGGVNQQNYKKCALENRNISVRFGMNPIKADTIRLYFFIQDLVWRIVKKVGLEKAFHKRLID